MRVDAILFDFDGVMIESEHVSNRQIADYLTGIGHPTTAEQSMAAFMGLADGDFLAALERHIGGPVPADFHRLRTEASARAIAEGMPAVAGAVEFVRGLPDTLPIAIASSSSTRWIAAHLRHLGLADRVADRIVSGREHVARGKPAPDVYLHAANMLGVEIARTLVIEDSPVGVTGAVASGAEVVGLCAGSHCGAEHGDRLRALGAHHVVRSFGEIAPLVSGSAARPPGR